MIPYYILQLHSDLTVSAVLVQPSPKPETRWVLTGPLFGSLSGSQQSSKIPAAQTEPALFPPQGLLQAENAEQISQVALSETATVLGAV